MKSDPSIKLVNACFAICIYYMPMAKKTIQLNFPETQIIGEPYYKMFTESPCYFETSFLVNKFKIVAEAYADKKFLFVEKGSKHNLGYEDSQALLSFAYCPPNNTVPIIWSSKSNWYPILPRFQQDILEQNKEFREQNALNSAKVFLQFPPEMDLRKGMSRKKVIVLSIIRLLNKSIALPVIANKLGLFGKDLDTYLEMARQMNLLDQNNKLSTLGHQKLGELISEINEYKEKNEKKIGL